MRTIYFNTGVSQSARFGHSPHNSSLSKGQVWRNGVKQIPFDVDAPENAKVILLCNTPDLPESKSPNVIVREVFNTLILSKYVYLSI